MTRMNAGEPAADARGQAVPSRLLELFQEWRAIREDAAALCDAAANDDAVRAAYAVAGDIADQLLEIEAATLEELAAKVVVDLVDDIDHLSSSTSLFDDAERILAEREASPE